MGKGKSVKRKYTRRAKPRKLKISLVRKSKSSIAAEALKAAQNLADYHQRLVGTLQTDKSNNVQRITELKAEIAWFKQRIENLERKIGQGVTVTTA